MRGERRLLRLGEFLVRIAARRLPRRVRDERYREWTAELPVILHDQDGGPWPWRASRMLGYALDTIRGTTLAPGPARHRGSHRAGAAHSWLGASWVLVLFPASTAIPLYLGLSFSGTGLVYWVVSWTLGIAMLVTFIVMRRRKPDDRWLTPAIIWQAGGLVMVSGHVALSAVYQAGWPASRLEPITLVGTGADAVWIICMGIGVMAAIRVAIQHWSQRSATPDDPPGRGTVGR